MTQRKPTPSYTPEFRTRGIRLFKENRANYPSDNAAYRAIASKLGLPLQPVDATQWLNLSAGVSNCNVFLGRSFNCLATLLRLA